MIPLYSPLPTPDEMRRWDEAARDIYGLPTLLLMENAGEAAFLALKEYGRVKSGSRVLVVMGKGNNGGDGAVLARLLHDEGLKVLVWPSVPFAEFQGAAREHTEIARKTGVEFLPCPGETGGPAFSCPEWRADLVVDALIGSGIRGDLRARELGMIRHINSLASSFIFSLDIPSGLCGHSGKARPEAVRAHATICFEAGKPGLFFPESAQYTGEITIRRVGIPLAVRKAFPASWNLLDPQKGSWAGPPATRHTGGAGKVLIIGGSPGMAGAPLLAALGALRGGAGLVHVALPSGLEGSLRAACPEVLSHPLGSGHVWREDDLPALLDLLHSVAPDVLAIGMGLGRNAKSLAVVKAILEQKTRPPAVLDADALYHLRLPEPAAAPVSGDGISADLLRENDVLTPHPGEMARLLPDAFFNSLDGAAQTARSFSDKIRLIQENRPAALFAFTGSCRPTLVLKGAGTLIGQGGRPTVLSPFAVAALGVGGSGDVLSGLCAALMASGPAEGRDAFDSACLAVHLHGRAGELLSKTSPCGHLAGEIANALLQARKELSESAAQIKAGRP